MKHYELKYEFNTLRFLGYNKDSSLGYFYDARNRKIIAFNVSKNKEALEYFRKLTGYIGLPSRREKFLDVYRIFELLGGKPSTEWRAIRVSISHSARKVTEEELVDFLLSNFGELDISFKTRHQVTLFYKIFIELVEATYSEILARLNDASVMKEEDAQKIISILGSMRSEYRKDAAGRKYLVPLDKENMDVEMETRPSLMYHYKDLEAKLKEYIPKRFINPFVPYR